MTPSKLYIWIVSVTFVGLSVVMLCLPRSSYSELEKRDLAVFPQYSAEKVADGRFTKDVSGWFSDTEPYRDHFMAASMKVRDAIRFSFGNDEEKISFHKTDSPSSPEGKKEDKADSYGRELEEYENHINADENAKIASAGIIIVGSGQNVRALNAFGGEATGGGEFINTVNRYQRELPGVKVYAMVIPLSSEFYTPDKAKKVTKPQQPFIKNIYSRLENGARGVNAYNALADHVTEDIYLRTDHHWAPLGAYYAAEEFARTAGVPFKPLSSYTRNVVKGYVGSMYGYSHDISLKNAPEDFVYYTPNGVNYTTEYRQYDVNKDYKVTNEHKPVTGSYFVKYPDGSSAAYSTFMGGDQKLTKVTTGTKNGRKVVVVKDSYGNALPGYLFYSFEEIHVVDFRYFTHNMKNYVRNNGITDLVFCVNVFNAYSSGSAKKMANFLTQSDGIITTPTPAPASSTSTISVPAPKPVSNTVKPGSETPAVKEKSPAVSNNVSGDEKKAEPVNAEPFKSSSQISVDE
ncbi:MAG: hypothetical protein K2N05_08480 [Muribaculaceae bacterium]|nr:hypothetical protein [Muribaculaceae bacterium]